MKINCFECPKYTKKYRKYILFLPLQLFCSIILGIWALKFVGECCFMMIRLCGFGNRNPNKINDLPISMNTRDSGARNEQDLESGETRPLICMLFFCEIRIPFRNP